MKKKVADFIGKHGLLSREGLHLVALSGGADSVALLLILKDLGYRLEAAHCNFHLRGEESNRDEAFVKKLCQEQGVPLHLIHFDTMEYANLHQVSVEMSARDLRYGYFRQLRQDIGAEKVCVAHHRDDAVETLLMNLMRGSGVHGLTGIRACNGEIVRPLLEVSRQEIEAYLHSIGQDYVMDSTNLVDDVVRNKIRLNVLPLLEQINPNVEENIGKTARFMQESERVITAAVDEQKRVLIACDKNTETESVSIQKLQQLPSPELFLHEWLSKKGFNTTQVEQLAEHLEGVSGRAFETQDYTLLIDREQLVLAPRKMPMKSPTAATRTVAARIVLIFIFCRLPYIKPEKPKKAIAISPAVISTIGVPLNGLGILLYSIFSLRPARIMIEIAKPAAVAKPFTTPVKISYSRFTLLIATPSTAQFVVIRGRYTPSA